MKLTSKSLYVIFIAGLLTLLPSCGTDDRPSDMPKLHSTSLTITQDGSPLADAVVTLWNNDSSQSKWIVGGRTDSQGVCRVRTQAKFDGCPVGKYKIMVTKTEETESATEKQPKPSMDDSKALDEYYKKVAAEKKYYDLVDEKYKLSSTSDLEIEIAAGNNSQKFDVGKAVKNEIKMAQ